MENMKYWDLMKTVPANRLKTIQAGRLKGKSDINPQWRYEILTEVFGVCGFGWKFTIEKTWIQEYSNGEIASFAEIHLFIKIDDKWSDPIPANGGSMFVANESRGPYVSDECFKMAITDALGTAAKMIGVASDVYQGIITDSKYSKEPQNTITIVPENTITIVPEKPWLNKDDFNKASEYLRTGGKIEVIKSKYRISTEMMKNLLTITEKL
jgi:hypothetical protein